MEFDIVVHELLLGIGTGRLALPLKRRNGQVGKEQEYGNGAGKDQEQQVDTTVGGASFHTIFHSGYHTPKVKASKEISQLFQDRDSTSRTECGREKDHEQEWHTSKDLDGLRGKGSVEGEKDHTKGQTETVKEHGYPEVDALQSINDGIDESILDPRDDEDHKDRQTHFEELVHTLASVQQSFRLLGHKISPIDQTEKVRVNGEIGNDTCVEKWCRTVTVSLLR